MAPSENGDDNGRLAGLSSRLAKARKAAGLGEGDQVKPPGDRASPGLGLALRVGIEMVAGVGVGSAVGFGLDRWLGTTPWLMVVFFFLGAGAGALNTYRAIIAAGFGIGGGEGKRVRKNRE